MRRRRRIVTTSEHVLHGCAPIPLAGYLKALGVFRLVAEQIDPDAKGFWRDERFVLRTRLPQDELVRFFVETYEPTPVVSPWNGGSGFWRKDNHEGFDAILANNGPRLASYRLTIQACKQIIQEHSLFDAPKEEAKADFIAALRAVLSENACRWLDGAIALTADGPRYPPILGTGGNDGRLDFSNNFMRRLCHVIDNTGEISGAVLQSALFSAPSASLERGAVGQFSPGTAGGVNAGLGFEAESRVNPWDFILTVEGALSFAAASVRRHAQDRGAALAFPFTTRAVGAGSGSASFADEADARAEFWAPLWSRASGLDELLLLMSEGRAVLEASAARDALDFARATAQLGIARGIDAFQRHGFLMRAGKAYFATPLGRVRVRENRPASLIADLDERGWLSRVRGAVRDNNAPGSLLRLGCQLDEALFRLAVDDSGASVQDALIAIGALTLEAGRRPKLRETVPPPRLSVHWVEAAGKGDESHEFALAVALASIDATTKASSGEQGFDLPFRRHLGPLSPGPHQDSWNVTTESYALAEWSGRDLARDMSAVLERRLLEAQRRQFLRDNTRELPLRGRRAAPLAAVAAFLAGRTDDARIASLSIGLAWARFPARTQSSVERDDVLPFAFAALRPLFDSKGVATARPSRKGSRRYGNDDERSRKVVDVLPLLRLVRAGRVDEAVGRAQGIARGAGLAATFAALPSRCVLDPSRLAAVLLAPLSDADIETLAWRAYPGLTQDEEELHGA
jgi:CRISPR-associated protein Csx17